MPNHQFGKFYIDANCLWLTKMQLVEELRSYRLDEEGLLRVPGNKQKMMSMQNVIENQWKNNHVDIKGMQTVTNILKSSGPHEIACLLKTYLRQLPESLFTQDCLDLFAQVGGLHKSQFSTPTHLITIEFYMCRYYKL